MSPVTVGGAASVIAATLLWIGWLSKPGPDHLVVAGLAVLAAAGAATVSTGAPTGLLLWDTGLRAGFAGLVVVLASRAQWRWLALSAVGTAWASTGSPGRWLAFAAAGAALAFWAGPLPTRGSRALVAGAAVITALQLSWPSTRLGPSAAAACVLAPMVLSGTWAWRHRVPRIVSVGVVAVGAVAVLIAAVAGIAALGARTRLERAAQETRAGLKAIESGDRPGAGRHLEAASADFRSADRMLRAPWSAPGLALPGLAQQERALQHVADAGGRLAAAGLDVLSVADPVTLRFAGGAFPVGRLAGAQPALQRAVDVARSAISELDRSRSPWLAPPLSKALNQMVDRVDRAQHDASTALDASRTVPAMLGADGPRRYFLAVLNPAESRGSGGVIGDFGQIMVDHGRMRLERIGSVGELNLAGQPQLRTLAGPAEYLARYGQFSPQLAWENVPMSPDFPSVGSVIAQLYPQSGGQAIDGVIAVDPAGLAALLKVTGPVSVPGWPEPITAINASPVFAHDQFEHYANSNTARIAFLQTATRAIWERLVASSAPSAAVLASAFLPSLRDRHIQLFAVRPAEEKYLAGSGAAGALPPVTSDSIGVVTQNATGNKADWFLHRQIVYRVHIDPSTGRLVAALDVTLDNRAPSSGEPPIVIDPVVGIPTTPGQNESYLSVYSPWLLSAVTVDGKAAVLDSEREAGRYVYSAFLVVPAGGQLHLHVDLLGQLKLAEPSAHYQLDVFHQPTLTPDSFESFVVIGSASQSAPATNTSNPMAAATTVLRGLAIRPADAGPRWDQRLRSHFR